MNLPSTFTIDKIMAIQDIENKFMIFEVLTATSKQAIRTAPNSMLFIRLFSVFPRPDFTCCGGHKPPYDVAKNKICLLSGRWPLCDVTTALTDG